MAVIARLCHCVQAAYACNINGCGRVRSPGDFDVRLVACSLLVLTSKCYMSDSITCAVALEGRIGQVLAGNAAGNRLC